MSSLSRENIEAFAEDPAACEIDAVRAAVGRMDYDEAAARAVARSLRGLPLPAELMIEILPGLEEPIAGIVLILLAEGGRAEPLVGLSEVGAFPEDPAGVSLRAISLYAAWRLEGTPGAPLRERLQVQTRRLSARWGDDPSRSAVAYLIRAVARAVSAPSIEAVPDSGPIADMIYMFESAIAVPRARLPLVVVRAFDESLPVDPDFLPRPVTVERRSPRIGRNDPCPCGSGRKYKKCHGTADAGGLRAAEDARPASRLSAADIHDLLADEVAALDFCALSDEALCPAVLRLARMRVWDPAQRALDELAARATIPPEVADKYRAGLIDLAVSCRRYAVAFRNLPRLRDRDHAGLDPLAVLGAALHARAPDRFEHLAAAAELALCDPSGERTVQLVHTLLPAAPAIGLLVARGCLRVDQEWHSQLVLDMAEEARARLGLPAGDLLLDLHASLQQDRQGSEVARSEADRLRRALRGASERARDLEERARTLEEQLQSREGEVSVSEPHRQVADPVEVRALRARIDDLKALIRERNDERAALRRALAAAMTAADPASPATPADTDRGGSGSDAPTVDDEDEGEPVEAARHVVVPRWARRAADALREVPAHVAGDALRTVAELAAGDAAAWRAVKRPKAMARPLLMTRIGRNHRLVFQLDDGGIEVMELVSRQSLGATLKRLRTG